MRRGLPLVLGVTFVLVGAHPAAACSGLIGARGSVTLGKTTTLAAYVNGVEHYVTAFTYSGGGGRFGSIVPLPANPSKIEKGGDWTLQRLVKETRPPAPQPQVAGLALAAQSAREARVVQQAKVDALELTVLEGGSFGVGEWAKEHGFVLPPDAPEVLDFYARRSPYFMAAVFDAQAAQERGQQVGDGTPIHLTMPVSNPWVPLRILGLGKQADERIAADVYLLTTRKPALLPVRAEGVRLERRVPASASLLADLRSDRGMEWVPDRMWLTHLELAASAGELRFDLAADVSGRGKPSWEAAGIPRPTPRPTAVSTQPPTVAPTPVATDASPPPTLVAAPVRAASSGPPVVPVLAVLLAAAAIVAAAKRRAS